MMNGVCRIWYMPQPFKGCINDMAVIFLHLHDMTWKCWNVGHNEDIKGLHVDIDKVCEQARKWWAQKCQMNNMRLSSSLEIKTEMGKVGL